MATPDPRPPSPRRHAGPLWDVVALVFVALVVFVFLYEPSYSVYAELYADFPAALSFLKFAVLATFGEMLVARLRTGSYLPPAFGLLPKAVVWGVLGVFIWIAFGIFSHGVAETFFADLADPVPRCACCGRSASRSS